MYYFLNYLENVLKDKEVKEKESKEKDFKETLSENGNGDDNEESEFLD